MSAAVILPRGIYSPVVTPFAGERVDVEALCDNILKWNDTGLKGYILLGSTGEAPLLNRIERVTVVREAAQAVREGGKALVVCVMEESTRSAVEFMEEVSTAEPDAFLVLPPTYYKPKISSNVTADFFNEIAQAAIAPLLLYNVPLFSGVHVESNLLLQLASGEVITGWKDSTDEIERFADICFKTGDNFRSFIGNPLMLLQALKSGASGGILAAANIAPHLCCGIFESFRNGDNGSSIKLQTRLDELVSLLLAPYGIAGIKAALDLSGFKGGKVRKPYARASAGIETETLEAAIRLDAKAIGENTNVAAAKEVG